MLNDDSGFCGNEEWLMKTTTDPALPPSSWSLQLGGCQAREGVLGHEERQSALQRNVGWVGSEVVQVMVVVSEVVMRRSWGRDQRHDVGSGYWHRAGAEQHGVVGD